VKTHPTKRARRPDLPGLRPLDCRSRSRARAGSGTLVAVVTALLALVAATAAPAQKNPNPQNPTPQNPTPQYQGPPNALQGFSQNRDQPVKIQADGLVVRDKDKMATFTGNVHVIQGDTEMRSKILVVFYVDVNKPGPTPATTMKTAQSGAPGSGDQQIRRIEATGGVLVTQKDQNAAGDSGIFDMQSNTVTLNGNVVVTHGKDVVRGQRLVVDLGSGVSRIDGGRVDALFGSAPSGEISLPGAPPSRPSHAN
jgi:lipopolysaccharide export system protein LptA